MRSLTLYGERGREPVKNNAERVFPPQERLVV